MDLHSQLTSLAALGAGLLRKPLGLNPSPCHAITGAEYRGYNALVLLASPIVTKDPGYVTENDIEVYEANLYRSNYATTLWLARGADLHPFTVYPLENTVGLERYLQPTQWVPLHDRIDGIADWFACAQHWPEGVAIGLQRVRDLTGSSTDQTGEGKDASVILTHVGHAVVQHLRTDAQLGLYHPQCEQGRSSDPRYEALVAEIAGAKLAAKHRYAFKPTYEADFVTLMQEKPEVLRAAAADAQLALDFLDNKVYDAMAEMANGSH